MVIVFTPVGSAARVPTSSSAPVHEFFTEAQIDRSNDFFDLVKWASWANLVLGLLTAVLLGFTSLGRRLVDAVRRRGPALVAPGDRADPCSSCSSLGW